MNMNDYVAITIETPMIDSGCYLDNEFTKLIYSNPWMVLCQTIDQVDSYHSYVYCPLTWDTKDILWMDYRVLTMTYESLATGSLKPHTLYITWSLQRWLSVKMSSFALVYEEIQSSNEMCLNP